MPINVCIQFMRVSVTTGKKQGKSKKSNTKISGSILV